MPSHYSGSEREIRALDAFIKLSRATETVTERLRRHLLPLGMGLSQLAVLEALLHLGPMNQREIGRKLLRSDSNLCTLLDSLEKAGDIVRTRSAKDRRVVIVQLSDQGRARIEVVMPAHAAEIARALEVLSPQEQTQLGALCKKLGLAARAVTPCPSAEGEAGGEEGCGAATAGLASA